MYFDTSSIIIIATTFVISLIYYHYKNVYSFWKRNNINGPKPYYGVGNLIHLFFDSKFTKKCIKQYGRCYGLYEGFKPILMISDAELARQICIKDFDIFPNHTVHKFINEQNSKFLFESVDNHWRRVRALMTPSFTSGKMRKMVRLLDNCGDDLLAAFEDQINESELIGKDAIVDLKEIYCLYTLDAISTCCYAIKLTRAKSVASLKMLATRDEMVAQAMEMFNYNIGKIILMYVVNEKLLEWLKFEALPMKQYYPLVDRISTLIKNRRVTERKHDDLLQMMVDAKLDDQVELDEFDLKENHHAALTNESIQSDQAKMIAEAKGMENNNKTSAISTNNKPGCMSDDEILANATNLMAVGIETTATFLSSCTYYLAFYRDVQDKLRDEIRKITTFDGQSDKPTFDYDTLTSSQYLDAVVSEGLRLGAPVTMTDRVSSEDYYIEKLDLTLPKGSKIYLDWENIMTDEEYWPEPFKFDPERFMPENKSKIIPGSYCPFGLGARHCIGMRFSLTESKLALAKMILKFQFEPAPGTKYPLEYKPNFGLKHLINPVVNIKRLSNK